MSEKQYISLKEAAKLSGYSADYVGQLIRAGKLPGKQVYSNISWVTTEEAILDYVQKERGGKAQEVTPVSLKDRVFRPEFLGKVYPYVAWTAIGIFALFILLLVYITSVSIDHRINQRYVEKLDQTK